MRVRVESVISPTSVYDVSAADFTLCAAGDCSYRIYLPVILKDYSPPPGVHANNARPDRRYFAGRFELSGRVQITRRR